MTNTLELYDLTIIGGGPAGLFATFYSGMRDMKTKLIEAQAYLGGRLNSYPKKMIWDVGGLLPTRADQLMESLITQAKTFQPTIVLNQQIEQLERCPAGHLIVTSHTGERHYTRTLLLSVGYGVMKFSKLDVAGVEKYEVTNLHYSVTDLEQFRQKRVLISGGGNSAVDWANELEPIAKAVTVVHRRDQFAGHENSVKKMNQSTIKIKTPYFIRKVNGTQTHIQTAEITKLNEDGVSLDTTENLPVDAIIVNHGLQSDLGQLKQWGLEMDERHILVNDKLETTIDGVYAAGDTAKFSNKINLLAGAFTDAAVAVNHAKTYIKPEAKNDIFISSHNAIFTEKNRALGVPEEDL
ncbi:thioredoxin reductase [Bacillus sp. JCM 19045]|nr:thioredoxin reductase [Bacillus sp. JCM 19045]